MEHKFKKSNADVKTIKAIQFGVISPEYLKNISVTQQMEISGKEISRGINNDICYDPITGKPNLGAINDPRMGNTNDPEHPGYCGHIELVRPVYHIGFLKTVIDILRCVSYYTSELLVNKEDYSNKKGRRNLKEITRISKGIKKCPITQKKLPTYTKEGSKIAIDHGTGKHIISPSEVYSILEKISDEDVQILGLNPKYTRPEWLLITTLCVPPPHVRPSVFMSSSQKCDDDLTTKLNEIVKTNLALANAIEKNNQDQGASEHFISQLESLLQYNISTFIDNQHPGQPPSLQRSGKPLKTIRERLTGKDGRVRGNLMGKRVDFSARTVITADPNISLDQVGVPKNIAMNLTIPVIVNDFNKELLTELVKRGPNVHPGAKYIIKETGITLDLKYANITQLQNGWTVLRHLTDGDEVIFNRQPSLHKMSMMGHKAKILDGSTFRLNLAYTGAYNADFDGDEMNLHVPQSLTARAEVEGLMMVDKLIVSPQSNKPVIGIIQDSLLSSCKMTRRNVFIKKDLLMNLIMLIDEWDRIIPTPAIIKNGIEYWTGKQVFSLILPKTLNVNNVKDQMNPRDTGILIKMGTMISGSVDKSVIGKSQGGLIHVLFNDYGSGTTKVFLNQIQKISNQWIRRSGFTVGVGDAIASDITNVKVTEILERTKLKVEEIIRNENGIKDPRIIEDLINTELNSAVGEAGRQAEESLNFTNNNFKATVSAGSKGSSNNIAQIMAVVGQQNIEGKRINYGFKHRTLPHYPKKDMGQESRGFVENNYLKGLTPQEFFFHAMAGREGLIDTACKSITGDTDILIITYGVPQIVKIGEWIDGMMERNKHSIRKYPEQLNSEIMNVYDIYMPTADTFGNTMYGKVDCIVRHDPEELMYKVTTASGRSIKVVESMSLNVYNETEKRYIPKLTSLIRPGDKLPVTLNISRPGINRDLRSTKLTYTGGIIYASYISNGHINDKTELIFTVPTYTVERISKLFRKERMSFQRVYNTFTVIDHKLMKLLSVDIENLFIAPKQFIMGFLEAYSNLNGVDNEINCQTERMAMIFSYLCNILGIFCYSREKSIVRIANKNLLSIIADTVADTVVSIERIDPIHYKKVYDVSIPETGNFTVFNGIVCKNTAEVGYVQRRLVKALEDVSVKYDNTVRNSKGLIIQFLYGDDGIDATYMENIHIRLLHYTRDELEKEYYNKHVPEEYQDIIQAQLELIEIARMRELNNAKLDDDYFAMPVHLGRILSYTKTIKMESQERYSDQEIYEQVNKLIYQISNVFGTIEKDRSYNATKLFRIYLRSEFATNRIKSLNKQQIIYALQDTLLKFKKAIVHAGEMCGILAAQSIGELTTQLTLNTFHSAGISSKNITLGVPRLKELINVTKKLKVSSLTMYENGLIKELSNSGQKRIIESIRSSIEYKTLQDIIKSSDIITIDDPEYSHDTEIIDIYKKLYSVTKSPINDSLSLRLQFSSKELEYADTSLFEICKLLEKAIGNEHKILCSDDNTIVNGKENLFIRIICDDETIHEQMTTLRKIEIYCMSIKIKGCEGINTVFTKEQKVNKWSPEKGHYKEPQWILETEGTNLIDTMTIQGIDHYRTISNNVIEIYEVFGIEAARQALLNELRHVLSFDGSYVNYRHIAVLVDTMTCRGSLTAMTRHGINRVNDIGTFTKCSFEETVEVLTDAAIFSEIDTLKGISDNIILGQTIPAGTGVIDVIYDNDMEAETNGTGSDKIIIMDEEIKHINQKTIYIPSEPDYDPLTN